MQQRKVKVRKSAGGESASASSTTNASQNSTNTNTSNKNGRRRIQVRRSPLEKIVIGFILVFMAVIAGAFLYQFTILNNENGTNNNNNGNGNGAANNNGYNEQVVAAVGGIRANVMARIKPDAANANANTNANANANAAGSSNEVINGPPHLSPPVPYLPIFQKIPNASTLIQQTLNGQPTIAGITALLQAYMEEFHTENMILATSKAKADKILSSFYALARKHLTPFDKAYENKPIFPIREDESIFLSLASFREHLLKDTLIYAFDNAKYPEKLFIGALSLIHI